MYVPRSASEITSLAARLSERGILAVGDIYSVAQLAKLNSVLDPLFASKRGESRSYVRPDEMLDAGILSLVLSRKMRDLLLSLFPDPVLYHFHAYEIAGGAAASHVFSEQPGGWHRDPDSTFFVGDPTHVSIFVYLSEVGLDDGPFEFALRRPDQALTSDSTITTVTGPIGASFIWHRRYYHRASPNRGAQRRRLIKISAQPNSFYSAHLSNEFFSRLKQALPVGDTEMDILLGKYQGRIGPKLIPSQAVSYFDIEPSGIINLSDEALRRLKRQERASVGEPTLYD